ncbi:MAG TPA: radical SAM protein [Methanophagales archaeon]|nr:radical SAM protein [Methanophagales archaeon]
MHINNSSGGTMLEKLKRIYSYRILQIEVSRACNLDCRICMRRNLESTTGFMSFDKFKEILGTYNFREVALHGWGEPLLNKDIFQMIEYAKGEGLKTSLTTNATLVGENISNILDSGLDDIAFGYYDMDILTRSIDNVKDLIIEKRKRGSELKTYLDIAIHRDNTEEIFEVIKKGHEIGVDAAVLHRLFNVYNVDKGFKNLSKKEEEELLKRIKEIEKELNFKIYLPKKHTLPCRIVKYTIFVTFDGRVTPCCFLPESYMGEGVTNILRSKEYRNFLANMKNHEVCSKCVW